MKDLDVVKLRRAIWVKAEMADELTIETELPAGLVGTVIDLNEGNAYVEVTNEDGGGFRFVVDLMDLDAMP